MSFKAHVPVFRKGIKDGVPISLGYFAVAFSLGIAARNAGLTPFQGFLASLLNNASAGEYAGFTLIAAQATYWEVALMTLIANARYLLMSCVLSQRFAPNAPWYQRVILGFDLTDELFGITIAQEGWIDPWYTYGAMAVSIPGWAAGTVLGIIMGNLLPVRIVSALSVALYGMFLAIIVPPFRKSSVITGVVLVSFACSGLSAIIPGLSSLSDGTRTIVLTVFLSALAAVLFPIPEKKGETRNE